MPLPPITGLVAATYTPFDAAGRLDLDAIGPLVEHLLADGVAGLFVCGTTGEGSSLTSAERRSATTACVTAAAGRVPVVAHVGHNSLADARELAADAAEHGIDAIAANSPSYLRPADVGLLLDCIADIAGAAPQLPFYYYHIPALTGVDFDMVTFLERSAERVPNLVGLKYTCPRLHEFQACRAIDGGRFDILWGTDEMLLGGLATGARGAVGSTFNIAAPLYNRLIAAYDAGDLTTARDLQERSVTMIRTIAGYPFHPAMKHVLRFLGVETGACRLPLPDLTERQVRSLRDDLEEIGFFEWRRGA